MFCGIISAEALLRKCLLGCRPAALCATADIDGFAKIPLQASIFASWYNKHNTKVEKRNRFSCYVFIEPE